MSWHRHLCVLFGWLILATLGAASPTQAAEIGPGERIHPPQFQESALDIRIDGKVDEAAWSRAEPIDDFAVIDPDTLGAPEWPTEVRVLYTERGLYVGYDMVQPAESIVSVLSPRDTGTRQGDFVGITIDPTGEGKYGYWMSLNVSGVQTDGTLIPESQFNSDWDGAWIGATALTDRGWQAEFYIPWSVLAMPATEADRTATIFLSRKVAVRDERWAVPALPFTITKWISNMRPMTLKGVNPKQQWSVIPYASVTNDEARGEFDTRAGAEVFWRPSSNFQVSASLLPDFGNVESDDVVVNLSAVEVFFPEKRLFFLEGRDIFFTTPRADPRRNFRPEAIVNTRRIGGAPRLPGNVTLPLSESARNMELNAAAKVTGAYGDVRYGFLAASEDDIDFKTATRDVTQDGSDYGIARALWESNSGGRYRGLGFIATSVTHPEQDARVYGVDGHYRSANGAWKLDGQVMQSRKDAIGTGFGAYADILYNPERGRTYKVKLSHYDDKLDINDLGFLGRNDASSVEFSIELNYPSLQSVRQVRNFFNAVYEVNGDGDITRQGFFDRLSVDLNNLHSLEATLSMFGRRTDDLESFGNGNFIIPTRWESSFEWETDPSKKWSFELELELDEEKIDGWARYIEAEVTWRPAPRFQLNAEARYGKRDGWLLHQENGRFTTFRTREWRPSLSVDYFFTAKQQFRLSAQWVAIRAKEDRFFRIAANAGELDETLKPAGATDDFSISNFNIQARYRWELAPLSDLFLVYTLSGLDRTVGETFDGLFSNTVEDPFREQLVLKFRYRFGS